MKIIKWIPEYLLIKKDKKDQIDDTLLGKYETNSITLLSFFIQKIQDELPKINKWDDIKNYSNEFKLNEFFDEYFLNNLSPRLLKGAFKFKGTNADLQYFLKIYNKTFTSKDAGNCNVDFISEIDLDNLISANDLFINTNPEQDISTIYKKRLPICANIHDFEFYFFLKDYLSYLKKDQFGKYYLDQNSFQENINVVISEAFYPDFYTKVFYKNDTKFKFNGILKFNYIHFLINENFNSILKEAPESDFLYSSKNFYKNDTEFKFDGDIKFINPFIIKENLNVIFEKSLQPDSLENDINNFYKNENFNISSEIFYSDSYNINLNENFKADVYERHKLKFDGEIKYNKQEEIYSGKNVLNFDLNKFYNFDKLNNEIRVLKFGEKLKILQIA